MAGAMGEEVSLSIKKWNIQVLTSDVGDLLHASAGAVPAL